MTTPMSEEPRTKPEPSEEGGSGDSGRADSAAARRLKGAFDAAHKKHAAENPEAGCVPWYHFPDRPNET